jgi:hypothetical protein
VFIMYVISHRCRVRFMLFILYFSYIMAVTFFGGGNRSTGRKLPKVTDNFII